MGIPLSFKTPRACAGPVCSISESEDIFLNCYLGMIVSSLTRLQQDSNQRYIRVSDAPDK
jgi:hypothetical protein